MAKIELRGVRMVFGKKTTALDGVDLTVEDGSFFVLLGPSGCGKTTILRLISGIERPTEGDVLFNGESVVQKKAQDRNVAMVFQNFALYPHLTVYRNIAYPLESRRMSKAVIDEKVCSIAEVFGITDLLKRRPRTLSGGQKQLVAIARAMVRSPDVFLLDEPFSNLDAELRDVLRGQVRKAHALHPETTFVYVTHDQKEALGLSDRMAVMREGGIAMEGSGREIYERPVDLYTAKFLGNPGINLFDGTVRTEEEGAFIEIGKEELRIPRVAGLPDGKRVFLGIRPEKLRLREAKEGESLLHGRFQGLARAGAGTQTRFTIDGLGEETFSSLDEGGALLLPGQEAVFAVPKEALLVFDPDSGKRIV